MSLRGRVDRLEASRRLDDAEGPMQGLRLDLRDGWLCDPDGRRFCKPDVLEGRTPLGWRGLPAVVVRHELAETGEPIGLRVVFVDGRGLETPERFRRAFS